MSKFVVNFFTSWRIFLSILVLIYALEGEWKQALVWLIAAELTDLLDGILALLLKVRSDFGELFDPLCDFVMVVLAGLGIVLTTDGAYPWIVMVGLMLSSFTIHGTLELVPMRKPAFKQTLFYAILFPFYRLSYVAVALAILGIYCSRAGIEWQTIVFIMVGIVGTMLLIKKNRLHETFEALIDYRQRQRIC